MSVTVICLSQGITSMLVDRTSRMSPLMASEVGVSRLFTEGLAFFLMQYGAGKTLSFRIFHMPFMVLLLAS